MPRKRVKGEGETISYRDLQVLDFICRFGVVNRTAVQWWAGTGRSVTLDRERRLREAGLISAHPPIGRSGPLLAVTSRGLRLADRRELGPSRVSVWAANHSIVCAQVAAWLEGGGVRDTVLSEREMLAEERQLGGRVYSAKRSYPDPGWHRPDLYRLTLQDGKPDAIIYLCPPKVVPHVERAVEKCGAGWCVSVQKLWFDHSPFARPESEPSGGLGADRQPPEGVGAKPLDGRAAAATVAARSGRHPGSE